MGQAERKSQTSHLYWPLCFAEKKKKSKKRATFDVDAMLAEATGEAETTGPAEPMSTIAEASGKILTAGV